MVVKPIALTALAALVIAAAGAGAYLAVRDNRVTVEEPAETVADLPGSPPIDVVIDPVDGEDDSDAEGDAGVSADTQAVEATETDEVITDEVEETRKTDAAPMQAQTQRVAPPQSSAPEQDTRRSDATRPKSEPPAREGSPAPSATDRDRPSPAPQASARDLPEAPGWERRSKPSPSEGADDDDDDEDESGQPDELSLRTVGTQSLGSTLPPGEPPPTIEELVLTADSVIGLQVDTPVSSDTAEVEDDVEARVTRDVMVSDRVAIPAGTRMLGSVVLVERAGQFKGASRLGVRFHTVVLDDSIEVPVVTETVYREGQARGGKSAAKIGGAAIGGAILGAIFGGGRGAAIGGAAGAAGGTAATMAGDGEAATLVAGARLTVRLSRPATVSVAP